MPRAIKRRLLLATLVLLSLLVPLGLAELGLRCFYAKERMYPLELLDIYVAQAARARKALVPDPVLGHVPVLGGRSHDVLGLRRGYSTRDGTAARVAGVRRVLFLGDSVTVRATIIDAIRAMRSTPDFEFLNGGVEAWNPVQEVEFYFRHHVRLKPDHIILTLHNNDFSVTSTGLYDEDTFTLCSPGDLSALCPELYRHCYLYRLFVSARNPRMRTKWPYLEMTDAVEAALRRLRDDAASHGQAFTVLLLPNMLPPAAWDQQSNESRRLALAMLDRLAIPMIDLLPAVEPLLVAGCNLQQTVDDPWHPSPLAGTVMAGHALAKGLLGPAAPGWFSSETTVLHPGEVQQLQIDAGAAKRGRRYLVVGSTDVHAASVEFFGLRVPFVIDAYTQRTLDANETILVGGRGTLDERGRATVSVPWPPLPTPQRTLCFWHACVLFGEGGSLIEQISSAVPLGIVP